MEHPDPMDALGILQMSGASQVTIHLREDRRHICDDDARSIIRHSKIPVNLECALNRDIVDFACEHKPHRVTFVPEKREEVTTEGGLDIESNFDAICKYTKQLKMHDVDVSLFLDPHVENIRRTKSAEIDKIEFHTGAYANIYAMLNSSLSKNRNSIKELEIPRFRLRAMLEAKLRELAECVAETEEFGIESFAGHGLNYENVSDIVKITGITELNIGQSIIARSVFVGLEQAILQMRELIE